ncbi:MAG: amidase [Kiloniellaceae bacterium]
MQLSSLTIQKLSDLLTRRETSVRDIVTSCLRTIEQKDTALHAFVSVFPDAALAQADKLDRELQNGRRRGPLHGIPVAIKDLADIAGQPTGFGSRVYAAGAATTDAAFVAALRAAGAVLIGKAQMVEFAFGSWGTNHALGSPVNPLDMTTPRAAGGSSSGSAVAVAAGMAPFAIGSDTGGSVRIPAALCGLVGLKTSTGLVPTQGVAPLSHTFDTIGPLTRSVEDAGLALNALAGDEPAAQPVKLSNLRLATIDESQLEPLEPGIRTAQREALECLASAGCHTVTRRFPLEPPEIQARNGGIMSYEAYASLHRLVDDADLPLDPYVRSRIKAGANTSQEAYAAMLECRRRDIAAFHDAFADVDAIFLPTTPRTAAPLDEVDESSIPMSRLTRAGNYYDLCGLTLPGTADSQGLPTGLQIMMRHGRDRQLLAVGAAVEAQIAGRSRGI